MRAGAALDADVLTDVAGGTSAFYDDGLGLCSYSGTLGGYCLVQLDGAAYLRGYQPRANYFVLDHTRPGEYLIVDALFGDELSFFDKRSGATGAMILTGGSYSLTQVRTVDRYLHAFAGNVLARPLDFSGAWTTEATLSGTAGSLTTWSRTRDQNVLAIAHEGGSVVYYDVVAQAQVGAPRYVGANQGAWYSGKHDVFVVLSSDAIKVFASAPRPASLSNPIALDPPTQARVARVRVRLLGADAEACAGELVDWSITAGGGALSVPQTETDAEGYALNEYIAPVTGAGSVTINAQVLF